MRNVNTATQTGITVGLRKDGSVAVLWDNDEIKWFSASEFAAL